MIEDLAEQYKIHANSVYKWRREYLRNEGASFPGHGNKVMSAEEQEIARLKKQLKEAELEKEILKGLGHLLVTRGKICFHEAKHYSFSC
ncbi:MAG: transposase [Saprospiraceae bacterium]